MPAGSIEAFGIKTGNQTGVINKERREFLYHKLAKLLGSPKRRTTLEICQILQIDRTTLLNWKEDPYFIKIKNSYLKAIRDEWTLEIQAVVIKKALEGSGYFVDKFFNLQDMYAPKKVEHTFKGDIPTDPAERQAEIDRLIFETKDLSPATVTHSVNSNGTEAKESEEKNGAGPFNI